MDELGFTKIAAAGLATALGFMVIRMLPDMFMHKEYPTIPAYSVGPVDVVDTGDAEPLPFPQPDWVASMNAEKGAKVFKRCQSCHNVENGGKNSTGPNLYGVVGNQPGNHASFSYSAAMTALETPWSFEQLDSYLTKPAKYLPGTKMSFIGVKKAEDRAAVIEYLRVAADNPLPQPAAIAAEPVVPADTAAVIEEPAADPTDAPQDVTSEEIITEQKPLEQKAQEELQ